MISRSRFAWWLMELTSGAARRVRVEVMSSAADVDDTQIVMLATIRAWGLASVDAAELAAALWFDGSHYWKPLSVSAVSERGWIEMDLRRSDRGKEIAHAVPDVVAGRAFADGFAGGYS